MTDSSTQPLVSVIIIFLDAARFIEEAIESVLAQTYSNWELFLVDDGSTDGSTEIALQYARRYPDQMHYFEHEGHVNRGMSATRNLGIRHAAGEYVALLDADDVWLPHKLERQVAIMQLHPEAEMVVGAARYWHTWSGNPDGTESDYTPELGIDPNKVFEPPALSTLLYPLGKGQPPCPSDFLMRRTMIERVSGFEEGFLGKYQFYEDQAFLAKVYLGEALYVSNETWLMYRVHSASCCAMAARSGDYHLVRLYFLKWLEKYLAQRGVTEGPVPNALHESLRKYKDMILA